MDDLNYTIQLKCLFCDSVLEGDSKKELSSGDMVKCQNCNELNDYDALIDVAHDEGLTLVKNELNDQMKKIFGKRFKK
jgi:Mg2+ and Co2+ transporter CorA